MNDKKNLAWLFALPALLMLFAIQFALMAAYGPLLGPLSGSMQVAMWLGFGVSLVLVAFGIARALRWSIGRLRLNLGDQRGLWLVKAWPAVWLIAWLALFYVLAGPDPSRWAGGLMLKPEVWGAFALCAAGLMLEARR